MTNQHHNVSARAATRQRGEWLLSAIAATTLSISWYLSAALDSRFAPENTQVSHTTASDFDAAFVAANQKDGLDVVRCQHADCPTQLAEADFLKAQL